MIYNAKNLTLQIDGCETDYVRFGDGERPLVMIPGLTLRGVKGAAVSLAHMYRKFVKDYTVYIFDRKPCIPEGYTVEDIAHDTARAMDALGLSNADVFGVSQGGMVAQYLAIRYPHLVRKLVLAVTLSRNNGTVRSAIEEWIALADGEDYDGLVRSTFEKTYSEAYLRKYSRLLPVLTRMGRPKDKTRFIRLAAACLTCSTYDELDKIQCPVFVIGGQRDKIVTGEASREIAEKLGCEIYMYDGLGHGAYEEAKDFNDRVLTFLKG